MVSILKLSVSLNQQYFRIDLKTLQEPNWDEGTEEQKSEVYEFRIFVKEDDVTKC